MEPWVFLDLLTHNRGTPSGGLKSAIERDLGGLAKFKDDFAEQGIAQFSNGWVWLVADKGKLKIEKTADAITPMAEGKTCLLAIDVWEHAYYLGYQNRPPDFLMAAELGFRRPELRARRLSVTDYRGTT